MELGYFPATLNTQPIEPRSAVSNRLLKKYNFSLTYYRIPVFYSNKLKLDKQDDFLLCHVVMPDA